MAQPLGRAARKDVILKFGTLIALPVNIYTAVGEDRDSRLKTVCVRDHPPAKIRQKYECPICAATSEFAKASEGAGGGLTVIDPEVLAAADTAEAAYRDQIDLSVHPAEQVSTIMQPSGKSYYLSAQAPGLASLYATIAYTVRNRPDLAFMARFTLKTAVSIFRLTVSGEGTLVLQQQAAPELIREMPATLPVTGSAAELAMASQLADALVSDFDPGVLGREKNAVLAEFVAGQSPVPALVPSASTGVMDLTSAFEAALAAATGKSPAKRRPAAKRATTRKAS